MDQQLCQTGLENEEILEVDADHNSIWLVKVNSLFYNRLVKFFRSITQEAPADVAMLCDKPAFNDTMALHSEPVVHSSNNGTNSRRFNPNVALIQALIFVKQRQVIRDKPMMPMTLPWSNRIHFKTWLTSTRPSKVGRYPCSWSVDARRTTISTGDRTSYLDSTTRSSQRQAQNAKLPTLGHEAVSSVE